MGDLDRKLVFISHANPSDNEAALWLATKLSTLGYLTWTDLTHLFGGDIFWDCIEDAIRNHAIKYIVLISKNSQKAQGVLDELNLAITIERIQGINRFVVPIRLDDLPFDQFKVNIGRKFAIDFSKNWANGLEQVLDLLKEDKVPKASKLQPNNITNWYKSNYLKAIKIFPKPQLLYSNWLSIIMLPEFINFSRIPLSDTKINEMVGSFSYPAFPYAQLIGSFASNIELQPDMPKWSILTYAHKIKVEEFIQGEVPIFPTLSWKEGNNLTASLLRKSWDQEMKRRGFVNYSLSDYSNAWFLPRSYPESR